VRGAYTLERTQLVAAAPEEVFAFFSDPGNLGRITPPWLSFRIHDAPARLEAGSRLEYRIRWGFFTLRWITRITRWNPPEDFQDIQEKGPYRSWIHTHRFTQTKSGVRVEDRVEYELPLGLLGRIVHRLRVRRQLEEIFEFRQTSIDRIFAGRPVRRDAARELPS
jgi:ligand-binding SRPBCC domain-containing protein